MFRLQKKTLIFEFFRECVYIMHIKKIKRYGYNN